jgi:hypothetical protein
MPQLKQIINKIKDKLTSEEIEKIQEHGISALSNLPELQKKFDGIFNQLRIHSDERETYALKATSQLKKMIRDGLVGHEKPEEHIQKLKTETQEKKIIERMEKMFPDHLDQPELKRIGPNVFIIKDDSSQTEIKKTNFSDSQTEIEEVQKFKNQEIPAEKALKKETSAEEDEKNKKAKWQAFLDTNAKLNFK